MKFKLLSLAIVFLGLLFIAIFSSPTLAQQDGFEGIEVFLESPTDGIFLESPPLNGINVNFEFTPVLYGSDNFAIARLIVNGIEVTSNQSAIINNTSNTITHRILEIGEYNWNIEVWNSTTGISAEQDFSLTIVTALPPGVPPPPPDQPPPLFESVAIAIVVLAIAVGATVLLFKRLRKGK
jgi:hypothetical protein